MTNQKNTTTDRLDAVVVQRECSDRHAFLEQLYKLREDSDGSPEVYIGINGTGRHCLVQVTVRDKRAHQYGYSPTMAAEEARAFLRRPSMQQWDALPAWMDFFSELGNCVRVIRLRSTKDAHTDRLAWLTKAERAEMAIVDKLMELESRERNLVKK